MPIKVIQQRSRFNSTINVMTLMSLETLKSKRVPVPFYANKILVELSLIGLPGLEC